MKKILLLTLISISSISYSQVLDGSFEAGPNGVYWTESSTNFGFCICNVADCGDGGGFVSASSGSSWLWLGGADSGGTIWPEVSTIEQSILIPSGSVANLNMNLHFPFHGPSAVDYGVVMMDGNVLLTVVNADSLMYPSYTPINLDISAYADGSNHLLRFEGYQNSDTSGFSLIYDEVNITVDGQVVNLFEETVNFDSKAYPNPANNIIQFQLGDAGSNAEIIITNMQGETVISESLNNSSTIDVSSINDGIYLYTIKFKNQITHGRFEVIH